jgi:gluconokinase
MERNQDVILALDIGSSSVRCSAYQMNGTNVIHSSAIPVSSVQPNSGKIKLQHGNETLLEIVDRCVDQTLVKLRQTAFHVVGVGFSSFVMNLIAIDKEGNFVDPDATISYACNTATVAQECQLLKEELGKEGATRLYQNTGAPIHSSYAIPQLRVLYQCAPELVKSIDQWQSIASLCLGRWTGRKSLPISYSEASWTGLLNFRECTYDESALALLPNDNCRDTLPKLADVTSSLAEIPEFLPNNSSAKRVKNPFWDRWPELRNASLFLGIGDGACANVGSKAVTESRIAVTIGTSAAARICLRQPIQNKEFVVPLGLFCYRIDKNHVLVGGALTDGGSVVEWASQLLNLAADKQAFQDCMNNVQKLADNDYQDSSSSSKNTSNLTMIPFLSGERATGFRGGATGSIVGLTRATTPAHFLKSCLEGVTLRLRAVLQLLLQARNGGESSDLPLVVVSGKALEDNDLWRQMIADSCGLKVVLDSETFEGTSRGVARLVAVALAAQSDRATSGTSKFLLEEELCAAKTNYPRPNAKAYFDGAAAMQEEFICAMSPLYTRKDG